MFTTVGYTESQDTGGNLTQVAALADQHVRVEGDNIIVPSDLPNLAGVFAAGTTITQAQINTPSLRRTVLCDVAPVNVAAEPVSLAPMWKGFDNPLPLEAYEPMRALVAEGVTGAEYEHVIVWLSDGPLAAISGDIFTVRATASTTLTAYAWTNAALTVSQTLPSGRYQVVGFRAESAGLIAARLVFVGSPWRPGVVGYDSVGDNEYERFRRGGLGVWGEFNHDQPPTVDFLSVSADTTEAVYLDLIKIA